MLYDRQGFNKFKMYIFLVAKRTKFKKIDTVRDILCLCYIQLKMEKVNVLYRQRPEQRTENSRSLEIDIKQGVKVRTRRRLSAEQKC